MCLAPLLEHYDNVCSMKQNDSLTDPKGHSVLINCHIISSDTVSSFSLHSDPGLWVDMVHLNIVNSSFIAICLQNAIVIVIAIWPRSNDGK